MSKEECKCKSGYHGSYCQLVRCPTNPENQIECSGNGLCNVTTGQCACNAGYTGWDCAAPFALLPGVNRTSAKRIIFSNETVDSYASRLDALELAQLLNESAMVRAHSHKSVHLFPMNVSTASNVQQNIRVTDFLNDSFARKRTFPESKLSTRNRSMTTRFTNANYYGGKLPPSEMRFQWLHGKILKEKRAMRSRQMVQSHARLVQEALSELDSVESLN